MEPNISMLEILSYFSVVVSIVSLNKLLSFLTNENGISVTLGLKSFTLSSSL